MSRLPDYPEVSEGTLSLFRRLDGGDARLSNHERSWIENHAIPYWWDPDTRRLTPAARKLIGKAGSTAKRKPRLKPGVAYLYLTTDRSGYIRIGGRDGQIPVTPSELEVLLAVIKNGGVNVTQPAVTKFLGQRLGTVNVNSKWRQLSRKIGDKYFTYPDDNRKGYSTSVVLAESAGVEETK